MGESTFLVEIPQGECERLLADSAFGRLGVVVDGRPEIFPVGHVWDEPTGTIVFPSNAQTKWRAALDWPFVAFEVDHLEPDRARGWSVAVVGRAEEVTDPEVIDRAVRRRPLRGFVASATGWLRIVPAKITGLRVTVSGDGESDGPAA